MRATRKFIVSAAMPFDQKAWDGYKALMAADGWVYVSHKALLFGNIEVTFQHDRQICPWPCCPDCEAEDEALSVEGRMSP